MGNGTLLNSKAFTGLCLSWCCTVLLAISAVAPALAAGNDPATDQGNTTAARQARLTLDEAVSLATAAGDPSVARFTARAEALSSEAVAEAQLPDPMVSAQAINVPTDGFDLDQEPMTQALRIGLRQEFPAGQTRSLRAGQRNAQADAERARSREALRRIELETRQAWLETAWHLRAADILAQSRDRIEQQIESLQSRYATGGLNAQSLLRSELELSLLDDRIAEHRRMAEQARAALARFIGSAAYRPVADRLPEFELRSTNLETLEKALIDHPEIEARQSMVEAADRGIELAQQAYKPKFAVEAGYGLRSERTDLASIGVSLSLPLFTGQRQDQRHQAAVQRSRSAQFERDARLRDLRRQLDEALTDWRRYQERLALYERVVDERAEQTVEASITTYANGQTDFAELIRSQLAALDVQIKQAELAARAGKAWARITYLVGESS
ncbi:MAG: TolC family protein [Wenzhouxiangella sp.]|nr:TolC family protein [Wenzhouxiangella sp.]